MNPETFAKRLREAKASAILRADDADVARGAMDAAIRGGFRVVEFTLTTPKAMSLIAEYSKLDLIVGAGTVMTPDEVRAAVDAGAQFVVSPVTDEAVIEAARSRNVATIPGTFTPTEMLRAHRAGATLIKLFPAPGTGPTYVRQILAPMPFLRIVPTAGVDGTNAAAYLAVGCWAVGFVSSLFPAEDLRERRYDRIEQRAREFLASLSR